MKKNIIIGTSYIDTPIKERLFKLWLKQIENFGIEDVLLIDSDSPYFKKEIPKGWNFIKTAEKDIFNFNIPPGKTILSYSENLGHICRPPGKDAWGRSLCQGLYSASKQNYDRIICIEYDMLWLKPLDILLPENEVGVCFFGLTYPHMLESGIMSLTSKVIVETDFIRKYDWKNSSRSFLPEFKIFDILKFNAIFYRDLKGARVEGHFSLDQIKNDLENWVFITHFSSEHNKNNDILEFFEKKYEIG